MLGVLGQRTKASYSPHWAAERYNRLVAESIKVTKEEFERVIRALLNTAPTPMADIPRKRKPKANKTVLTFTR